MKVYTTDKIRNIVLLGHGGAGKTTLAEAMCYLAGLTSRVGRVEDGNTVSDFTKEEQKRGFSIKTSLIPVEWQDCKINILDTPGYFDFVGEVEEAISVADGAIIVISGKAGVEVGTERAWELCEKYNIPRMFFVTDMDIDNVSYRSVVEQLSEMYGKKIAPFNFPFRVDEKFAGYVNVIAEKAFEWKGKDAVECAVPDYSQEYLENYRDTLMETVAETSEEFMERYFEGDVFSDAEIRAAVRSQVLDGSIVPVEMGASTICRGVYTLMDDIVKYMPSPEHRKVSGINLKTNEIFEANFDFSKPKSAYIFKTIVDPFIGRYSLIKIRSGVFKTDDTVYDTNLETEMRIGKLYIMQGNKTSEVPELHAGDIGAMAKLNLTQTGDTIAMKNAPIMYHRPKISQPYTYKAYTAKNKGEEDKIASGLAKLMDEDLTLKTVVDAENRQSLIYGIGDQQLDIVVSKLASRYKAEINLDKPKFAFRETLRRKVEAPGRYKKQSGGHGQFGDVKMSFEPSGDLSTPYVFEEQVFGGSVPKNYFPAVEKGIAECCTKGPLAAYPVVGIKAILLDGSYHPVDSSEMAFKMAANIAFKKGFMEANPILLEPIVSLKVNVPDSNTGDVMGDLNRRRGRVLGMEGDHNGKTVISADIPISELYGYGTDLRSMTGGLGDFSYEFARYEQCPGDVQAKEVEARAALVKGGDE